MKTERKEMKTELIHKPKLIWLKYVPLSYPWLSERYLRRLVAERRIRSFRLGHGRKVYLAREDLESLPNEIPALRS
jgi:hypothetical protein